MGYGVRLFTVKIFIGPKHYNQLVVANIGDVVRPAGYRIYHLSGAAIGSEFNQLVGYQMAEPKERITLNDKEFFSFGVVVMPTTGNPRVRCEIAELTTVGSFEHFHKHTTRVRVLCYLI